MGILRGVNLDIIEPLTETIITSGLRTIEVAMNTPDAEKLIRQIAKSAKKQLTIGAGTVLTMNDLRSALGAGATFIVLPTLVDDIVEYCAKNNIPVFPGALTPQEIYNAWKAGATMVKIFPAKFFGPAYLKEIKAPFKEIELLACGGITSDNIKSFFSNGASGVAFGASVFKKEWLAPQQLFHIDETIKEFISGYNSFKQNNC